MSRVGKQPINVPSGTELKISGNLVSAKGPKGSLEVRLPPLTKITLDGSVIRVERLDESSTGRAMHGLARSIVNNLVEGVSKGYQKRLEIQGVGFKASVQGSSVNLMLGFSHPILYALPVGIQVVVEDNTKLTIAGASKEAVGRVAAELRSYYPPEPYKGKGVRYAGEKVVRKEGKTVQ